MGSHRRVRRSAVGAAGSNGFGSVASGSLEQANVDITEELVALINAQRNFQANAKAIDARQPDDPDGRQPAQLSQVSGDRTRWIGSSTPRCRRWRRRDGASDDDRQQPRKRQHRRLSAGVRVAAAAMAARRWGRIPGRAQASEEVVNADMKAGTINQTGRDLDVAMQGDAMLAVQGSTARKVTPAAAI